MQPGDEIRPDHSPPAPAPQTPPANLASAPPASSPPEPTAQGQFAAEDTSPAQSSPPPASSAISWTAPEYHAHQKSWGWYASLGLAACVGSSIVFLLTHDKISTGVILLVAVLFAIFAASKPRTLTYKIDDHGIYINQKLYLYSEFKSFSVVDEAAASSISLLPLKRFMPPISMYYQAKDEDEIFNTLSLYLPYEEHKSDTVDLLMRKIRL